MIMLFALPPKLSCVSETTAQTQEECTEYLQRSVIEQFFMLLLRPLPEAER